ncbi:hypothetical protein POV26_11910 [Aequorivita todarodis]|uniref:hypothetical protein n=1 Tax=Aequorivita todarodis TaxID=2036821 RepID=UPI00234FB9C7|nr:hypothetical protein [Aequorivita todarodis]MDC8001744.1 hypothetical protein [Aequorivita todarodis]
MKKVLMIFALAAFTTAFAQDNKSEKTETVVTKVKVKDNKGVHTDVKEVTRTETQPIKLDPKDAGKTDQDYELGPTRVQTDVNYSSADHSYMFENEKNGYKIYDTKAGQKNDFAILRPTSKNGYYIMSQAGNNSFGYFNEDGNFVVESYNPKTDAVEKTIYKLEMKSKTSIKQNKM